MAQQTLASASSCMEEEERFTKWGTICQKALKGTSRRERLHTSHAAGLFGSKAMRGGTTASWQLLLPFSSTRYPFLRNPAMGAAEEITTGSRLNDHQQLIQSPHISHPTSHRPYQQSNRAPVIRQLPRLHDASTAPSAILRGGARLHDKQKAFVVSG